MRNGLHSIEIFAVYLSYVGIIAHQALILTLAFLMRICTRLKFIGVPRVLVNSPLTTGITMSEGERKCYARSLTTIVMYCLSQIYWHLCLVAFAVPRGAPRPLQMRVIRTEITRRSFSRAYTSRFRGNIRSRSVDRRYLISRFAVR